MGLFDPVSVDTQERMKHLDEIELRPKTESTGVLNKITIGELYVFLLKLMVAGFLALLPICLLWWFVSYATTH